MTRFRVTITCPCCGDGEITCSIAPEEPMVRYYPDGSGYPGCPASVDDILEETCMCNDFLQGCSQASREKYERLVDEAAVEAYQDGGRDDPGPYDTTEEREGLR
jgi:hypothetical protein